MRGPAPPFGGEASSRWIQRLQRLPRIIQDVLDVFQPHRKADQALADAVFGALAGVSKKTNRVLGPIAACRTSGSVMSTWVTVFAQIRLSPHSTEAARKFETRIRTIDEVLDCHLMTGDTDYLLQVVVPGLEAYERFIRERIHPIPDIASINTSFAYGVVELERVFPWVVPAARG